MKTKIIVCNILAICTLVASSSTATTTSTVSTTSLIEVQEQDVVNHLDAKVQEKEARDVNQTATDMIDGHEEQEENTMKHTGLRGVSKASFELTFRDLEAAFERDLQLCSPRNGPCVYDSACCGSMQCIIPSGTSTGTCKSRRVVGINNVNCRLRDEACRTDQECCGGLDCKNNRCFGHFTGFQRCGERFDSCIIDLDCCSELNLICDEFLGLCDTDVFRCSELFGSCINDVDCCSGLECNGRVCITRTCSDVFGTCVFDDDCCSGLECDGRVCRTRTCSNAFGSCVNDDDCCSGLECDGRVCRTRSPNQGNRNCGLAGEFCRSDSECCTDELDTVVCFSRVCRPFTTETDACVGRGQFCINDFDCCGGFTDGGLFCDSDNTCQREASTSCSTAAGAKCSSNGDCCGGNLQCAPNGRCTRIYTGPGYP